MTSETCANFRHNECRRADCECSCHNETSARGPQTAVIELGWLIERWIESAAKADAQEYLAQIDRALDALERIAHLDETEGAGDVGAAMEIARAALDGPACDAFFPKGAIVSDVTQVEHSVCVCGAPRRWHTSTARR